MMATATVHKTASLPNNTEIVGATASAESAPEAQAEHTRTIDIDVHHSFLDSSTLFPYLPRQYVEYIKDFGDMMPNVGYTNVPGRGARHDLWVGTEINPSTVPEVCIEKHLDLYDIDVAVLTGGPYFTAVHPDAAYAA